MLTGILPDFLQASKVSQDSGSGRILRAQDEKSRDDPVINQRLAAQAVTRAVFVHSKWGKSGEEICGKVCGWILILSHQVSFFCAQFWMFDIQFMKWIVPHSWHPSLALGKGHLFWNLPTKSHRVTSRHQMGWLVFSGLQGIAGGFWIQCFFVLPKTDTKKKHVYKVATSY